MIRVPSPIISLTGNPEKVRRRVPIKPDDEAMMSIIMSDVFHNVSIVQRTI